MPGMGQMIQMIATLGDMQQRKKQLELDTKTHKDAAEHAAKTLGLAEDDQRFNHAVKWLTQLTDSSLKSRQAMKELGPIYGFSPEDTDKMLRVALVAPETVQSIRDQAATAGRQQATAAQQAATNAEAYTGAAAGQTMGGMTDSQTTNTLFGGGTKQGLADSFGAQMLPQFAQGAAMQRFQPLAGQMQAAGMAAGMAPQMAQQNYLGAPTQQQQIGNQQENMRIGLGQGQLQLGHDQQTLASQQQAFNQTLTQQMNKPGQMDMKTTMDALTLMQNLQQPKALDTPESRTRASTLLNFLALQMGRPELGIFKDGDIPKAARMFERFLHNQLGIAQPGLPPVGNFGPQGSPVSAYIQQLTRPPR